MKSLRTLALTTSLVLLSIISKGQFAASQGSGDWGDCSNWNPFFCSCVEGQGPQSDCSFGVALSAGDSLALTGTTDLPVSMQIDDGGVLNLNGNTFNVTGSLSPRTSGTPSISIFAQGSTLNVSGDLTLDNNSTLSGSGSTIDVTGTFQSTSSMVNVDGATITVGENLSLSGSTLNNASGSITVTGDLSLSSSSSLNGDGTGYNVDGAISVGTNSTLDADNATVDVEGNVSLSAASAQMNLTGSTINFAQDISTTGTSSFVTDASSIITADGTISQELDTRTSGNTVSTLNVNNGTNTLMISGGGLSIMDSIGFGTAATLNANGSVTLVSSASQTARIGVIPSGGSISGSMDIQQYRSGSQEMWQYLSSPVSSTTVADWQTEIPITGALSDPSTGSGIDPSAASMYYYDETQTGGSSSGWEAYPNNSSNPSSSFSLTSGRGYSVWIRDNSSNPHVTSGTPNTGSQSFSGLVTYTNSGVAADDGWCMIGNPYASPIDWQNVTDRGGFSNLDGTVYFIDNDDASNRVKTYNNGVGSPGGTTGVIAAQQGFWVKANASNPSLTLTEADKTSSTPTFYKGEAEIALARVQLLDGEMNFLDETVLRFSDGASQEFDPMFDARKFDHSSPNTISTPDGEGGHLVINGVNLEDGDMEIPLEIVPGQKSLSLSISTENLGTEEASLYLKDKLTGSVTEIMGSEALPLEQDMIAERYAIVVAPEMGLVAVEEVGTLSGALHVFPNPSQGIVNLMVEGSLGASVLVEILKPDGSLVAQKELDFQTVGKKSFAELSLESCTNGETGVYFVTLETQGQKTSTKVVVE